jgi:hypothetical protein
VLTDPIDRVTIRSTGRFRGWRERIVLLLLVFAVPTLAVLAKTSWYLPHSDTGHYLTGAIKMKTAHSPAVLGAGELPLHPTLQAPPQPVIRISRRPSKPEPAPPFTDLTVSIHRRPPPSSQTI